VLLASHLTCTLPYFRSASASALLRACSACLCSTAFCLCPFCGGGKTPISSAFCYFPPFPALEVPACPHTAGLSLLPLHCLQSGLACTSALYTVLLPEPPACCTYLKSRCLSACLEDAGMRKENRVRGIAAGGKVMPRTRVNAFRKTKEEKDSMLTPLKKDSGFATTHHARLPTHHTYTLPIRWSCLPAAAAAAAATFSWQTERRRKKMDKTCLLNSALCTLGDSGTLCYLPCLLSARATILSQETGMLRLPSRLPMSLYPAAWVYLVVPTSCLYGRKLPHCLYFLCPTTFCLSCMLPYARLVNASLYYLYT